jgi:hypothetical protein
VIAYLPRTQSASTAAAPAASQPAAFSAGGAAEATASPQGSLTVSAPAPVVTGDRSAARASATPADASKEVGRLDQAGPSSNAVGDQSTRLTRTAEPTPFAMLLSPWLWLVLAIAFAALSFVVGRRLRST